MGILSSLYSGVSGLAINSNAMNVIGNNLANSNTIGFKSGRMIFSDLLPSSVYGSGGISQIGRGVSFSSVDNIFSQGTFQNTDQNTDLAIEGDGFFMVKDPTNGGFLYTRAGSFRFNADGCLTNPEGFPVQGYALDKNGNISGALTDIQLETGALCPAQSTENITLTTNLNADADYVGPFAVLDPAATSNYATSINIYDSLGNAHLMTVYFTKMDPATNPLEWEWNGTVDGTELGGAAGPVLIGNGSLTFDADGEMAATTPSTQSTVAGALTWSNNSVQTQQLDLTFNTTQYSSNSILLSQSQDGYATGNLNQLLIDNDGKVLANYTNGQSTELFQIALAKFSSPQGLLKQGNSLYAASPDSGDAVVGIAGSGLGKIFTNALEQSNVDIAQEFVNMITVQRGFQASSKIITTTDEMLSDLINLKR